MRVRTRWMTLAGLLIIWGGIAFWVMTQSPQPQRVPLTFVSGQKATRDAVRGKSGSGKTGSDLKIQLDLLAVNRQRAEKSFGSPKNIFAPVFPGQMAFTAMTDNSSPVPQLSPEELAVQAGRQELAQFRYLGYLIRGGRDEAFLAKGNILHIAKAGDTIDQRVLVKTVTPAGVTLQETGTHVEQTVAMLP
jgi:hypothetical protein